ncbi:MAG: glycosyltransferase [Cyclobacteriaceae bacterium]|nr:glycosyltransferase [Cyclobacteriaceae bacterium]
MKVPNTPTVSVVIPTFNREQCLVDFLHSLARQNYLNYEIIIVDQSENISDAKRDLIKLFANKLKYYHIEERGRSLAKNYGIQFSSGDIIIFCDDDIIVPENFISTHVETLADPFIAAASCRLVEQNDPDIAINKPLRTTSYGQLVNKPYSTVSGYVTSLNGGNMSFKRVVLNQVGYFEEYFEGTSMVEEPDIAYRIIQSGHKIYFNASITVYHYPQYNGNIAEMKDKRATWFYYYFFNLSVFYLKYGRVLNMLLVFFYCIALSIKHVIKYSLNIKDYKKMISGFFNGFKRGMQIKKLNESYKYHTPTRYEKKSYKPLIL